MKNEFFKYCVTVTRISYSTQTFTVSAQSEDSACVEALDRAYNSVFSEDSAEYEISHISQM